METNPYSTPVAMSHEAMQRDASLVSAAAVEQLAATKPWVRFISVITFIGAGFMLIAAIAMAGMGGMGMMSKAGGPAAQFTGGLGFVLAAVYAVLAIIYIYPGVKLWKYAGAIALLIQSGRNEDLVAALNQQRSFWKFAGIMVLLMLLIYVVVIVVAMFGGIVAASRH